MPPEGQPAGSPRKSPRKNWSRAETLVAFRLYCATPFGKLNHTNPDIIALADKLGRTPSSVSMKACNFARPRKLDPTHQARGVAGLAHGAKLEETIWDAFHADSESLADAAEAAYEALRLPSPSPSPSPPASPRSTYRIRPVTASSSNTFTPSSAEPDPSRGWVRYPRGMSHC